AERTGIATFGLRVVEAMDLSVFDVQIYAFFSSANLGEGIERIIRYQRLNHDAAKVTLIRVGNHAIFRHQLPDGHMLPSAAAQFVIGSAVKAARAATARDVAIEQVRFQHEAPSDISEYERVLGAPAFFSSEYNEIVFANAALEVPHDRADPGLAAVLDRHGEAALSALPRVDSLADRVRSLLAKELQGGNPSADTPAERLRMSTRTLARRLTDEGTSHKEVLDDLRGELAQRYLGDPNLAIAEVAFLLGFSEPSAFHRAFKRWTGQTPSQFRSAP
ncbi:MAG: AraC family transcriptional regulator ligand-binding domain-containing protein, partial [Nannocystaceae bacterium]